MLFCALLRSISTPASCICGSQTPTNWLRCALPTRQHGQICSSAPGYSQLCPVSNCENLRLIIEQTNLRSSKCNLIIQYFINVSSWLQLGLKCCIVCYIIKWIQIKVKLETVFPWGTMNAEFAYNERKHWSGRYLYLFHIGSTFIRPGVHRPFASRDFFDYKINFMDPL